MKFHVKRYLVAAPLLLSLLQAGASQSQTAVEMPAALKSDDDWNRLFAACESSWDQFETGLNKLRTSMKREIDAMSHDEFINRYMKDDPMIRFARVHWPILFSSKDTGWKLYRGCAERNLAVRKVLDSSSVSAKDRTAKIEDLKDCVVQIFGPRKPLQPPFDRLIACYRRHAK